MRVISGSARGIRLQAPAGLKTRPTSDRVKEALFNIIQCRMELEGCRVLDICAGSGALGIESLSRGAASCCFVDSDRAAISIIRSNLAATRLTDRSGVFEMQADRALLAASRRGEVFDLILFDPPYASEFYTLIAEKVCSLSLLSGNGLFVAEISARKTLPDRMGQLVKSDSRTYGDTALDFYVLEE